MSYSKNGTYEYVRVARAAVSDEKEEEEACVSSLKPFMMKMKECLKETLEEEHRRNKFEADIDDCSQRISLSDVICPKIFKVSFDQHSKGFAQKATLSPDNV